MILLGGCAAPDAGESLTPTANAAEVLAYGAVVRFRAAPGDEWVEGVVGRAGACTAVMAPLEGGGFRPVLVAEAEAIELRPGGREDAAMEWVAVPIADVRRAYGDCSPF